MRSCPKLLIVDDELGVRESLRAILSQDCDVKTAASGEAALAIIEHEPVDLVTLDLRMPGMGGIGVLEAIKRHDEDIEVLIITGYGSYDTAVQGLRHRAFDYISKPFDSEDVRRLVQAALARRAATQRLRAAPDNILATLSHEFRTPLNVIMGYSSMLREAEDEELSDEQRLALDRIQANSTALLSYVETLFYMVELDRGLVPTTVAVTELRSVVDEVLGEVRAAVRAKGLRLTAEVPADAAIRTDRDMLARALLALVENAVRYTEAGDVCVRLEPRPAGIAMSVTDTGVGMSSEAIAEALEVVERSSPTTSPRLLGFGFRLVGRLVRALEGSLEIVSRPGDTRVVLSIPDQCAGERPAATAATG